MRDAPSDATWCLTVGLLVIAATIYAIARFG